METGFTVDRKGQLQPGMTLTPVVQSINGDQVFNDLLAETFPTGISVHGSRYLLTRTGPDSGVGAHESELVAELVRRLEFPGRPSRFSSVFGCRTLEKAKAFRAKYGEPQHPIFKVEAAEAFDADMNCVGGGLEPLVMWHFARQYWQGLQGPNGALPDGTAIQPFWEMLLVPPALVVEQVAP